MLESSNLTRREVLRGLGGLAIFGPSVLMARPARAAGSYSVIAAVENQPQPVGGVIAYAQKSLHAGETIDFRVSADVPYQLDVVRLGWDPDGTSRDWTIHSFPSAPAQPRSIRPGSYVHVERALESSTPLPELTLECWVRPFRHRWSGLITQYGYPAAGGFGLFVAADGRPVFYFGDGGPVSVGALGYGASALPIRAWTHLCAVFDNGTARLFVNGEPSTALTSLVPAVVPGSQPLRLGAYGDGAYTSQFFDGDLAMPAIYERALSDGEIAARAATLPPSAPSAGSGCVACWPFDEESGTLVADVSGCDRTGLVVNRGTWMVGGPGFDGTSVPRFGAYDPDSDATRGHALRLSASDLYDCAWPVSHSFTLPSELPPGVYVGRVRYGSGARYDETFLVKRALARPRAHVLVVCATSTWHAYNRPFGLPSFYVSHAGGQPTYYVGENLPWPSADPYAQYVPAYQYSHLLRAERFTHVWLEENGYAYDVVSDRDLHDDPGMLADYAVLFILGHSEYWSREAYEGVVDHLANGGKVVVGSGNTMFWRVSYDEEVIECRKLPTGVGGFGTASYGELYHEHDHLRGGLMREAGHPAWAAIGLECVGYGGPHVPYEATDTAHEFFQMPEAVDWSGGTRLGGDFAVGHEWDARLQSIPGSSTPPVPGYYTPVVLAEGRGSQNRLDYQANWYGGSNQILSEIIDWQKPGGGRVLSIGSIATGMGLQADSKMSAMVRNALHRMGVQNRLEAAVIASDGTFRHRSFDGVSWIPGWIDRGAGFGDHPPTAVEWAPERISLMAIDGAGDLRYRFWNGQDWSAWTTLGGGLAGRVAAVGWGRNRLHLLARGGDGTLREYAWDGTVWSGWTTLGTGIVSDPTAIAWEGTRLAVAALGAAGEVLYKWRRDGTWFPTPTSWQDMGGSFAHAPTLFAWGGNRINLFAVDAAGDLYNKWWNGAAWQPSVTTWEYLGGGLASRVVAAARGADDLSLFAIGTDGQLKVKWWDGSSWFPSPTGWQDMGGDLVGEPTVAAYRGGSLSVIAVDTAGRAQRLDWNGSTWSAWQNMGGDLRGHPTLLSWIGTGAIPVPEPSGGLAAGVLVGAGLAAAAARARRRVDAGEE